MGKARVPTDPAGLIGTRISDVVAELGTVVGEMRLRDPDALSTPGGRRLRDDLDDLIGFLDTPSPAPPAPARVPVQAEPAVVQLAESAPEPEPEPEPTVEVETEPPPAAVEVAGIAPAPPVAAATAVAADDQSLAVLVPPMRDRARRVGARRVRVRGTRPRPRVRSLQMRAVAGATVVPALRTPQATPVADVAARAAAAASAAPARPAARTAPRRKKKKQGPLAYAGNLLLTAALFIALSLFATAVAAIATGHRFETVVTGSMTPTIPVGSMVLTERVPTSSLQVGDVLVFPRPCQETETIVHRIIQVAQDGQGNVVIHTKGDANTSPDTWCGTGEVKRPANSYADRVRFILPGAGNVADYARRGALLGIMVVLAGIVLYVGYRLIRRELRRPAPVRAGSS